MPFCRREGLAAVWLLLGVGSAAGQSSLRFEHPGYVAQPGEPLEVRIFLEPSAPSGLFSYGVKLSFDPVLAPVPAPSAISVPAALDFHGVEGPGAFKEIGNGFAGVKGTVDFFATPIEYYGNSWLATFTLRFLTPGDYPLGLELFQTLGPAEAIFVTGSGMVLDPLLVFGSAQVQVVPEPDAWMLMVAGLAGLGLLRSRSGRRRA